jgi:hypothetical protein
MVSRQDGYPANRRTITGNSSLLAYVLEDLYTRVLFLHLFSFRLYCTPFYLFHLLSFLQVMAFHYLTATRRTAGGLYSSVDCVGWRARLLRNNLGVVAAPVTVDLVRSEMG